MTGLAITIYVLHPITFDIKAKQMKYIILILLLQNSSTNYELSWNFCGNNLWAILKCLWKQFLFQIKSEDPTNHLLKDVYACYVYVCDRARVSTRMHLLACTFVFVSVYEYNGWDVDNSGQIDFGSIWKVYRIGKP